MQLQFYSLLTKTDTKFRDTIPRLVASGIVLPDGIDYKVQPWDGSGEVPIAHDVPIVGKKRQREILELDRSRCKTKCSDSDFARVSFDENNDKEDSEHPGSKNCGQQMAEEDDPIFWPYIVQSRCDGCILERVYVSLLPASLVYVVFIFLCLFTSLYPCDNYVTWSPPPKI